MDAQDRLALFAAGESPGVRVDDIRAVLADLTRLRVRVAELEVARDAVTTTEAGVRSCPASWCPWGGAS